MMYGNRRKFLKTGSLALAGSGAAFMFPMELLASMRKRVGANDRINVGLIGCNGMGFSDLSSMLKLNEIDVIGLCDVDENVLKKRSPE